MATENKHEHPLRSNFVKPPEKSTNWIGWQVLKQAQSYTADILRRRQRRYGGDHNGNSHGTSGNGFRGRRIVQDGRD